MIHLVSIGLGGRWDLVEFASDVFPPSNENDFAINDFSALQTKWNESMSQTCTEPALIPGKTTVLKEVAKDK